MRRLAILVCAASSVACATAGTGQVADGERQGFVHDRMEVALALVRYDAAVDDAARASALTEAWRHRGALVDDTILRQLLRASRSAVPDLRSAQLLEQSAAALGTTDGIARVRAQLQGLEDPVDDATRWTAARRLLLLASILPPTAEQQALVALRRVARLKSQGGIGAAQRAQAWLTEGSLEHQAGRYKEAIAAYLKVEASSGLWREARLGMAWSQLRIVQPERAIAVLALLPGGLTGDPERALVAAMSAGALNKLEAAREVIREAKARAGAWLDGEIEPMALLQEAMPLGASLRLREEDEGLFVRLKAHPSVRLFAAELAAARDRMGDVPEEGPERVALEAYVARLERVWPGILGPMIAAERARVHRALDALDALEPQLK